MTWEEYRDLIHDAEYQKRREERAREWAEIVKLLRLNIEKNIADAPLTIEETDQMVRALQKVKTLPDFRIEK